MGFRGRVADERSDQLRLTGAQIASVTAGNALEFYDFVTYTFFATQIGRALFPGDESHSLLFSLATFGVGFLTRPLGGLIIGRMADRRGRKPAMILTFTMMGVAMTGLALTPSYAAVGMLAPILAVAFRLLQGFSLGGEVGPNIAYLMEAAPRGRRALFISLNFASADFAVLVAGLVGLGLSSALSGPQLESWGWRVAFLLGATIVPFGLRLRRTLSALGDGDLRWIPSSDSVLAFARGEDFICLVNFGADPVDLPDGTSVLLASSELEGGALPHDSTAWLRQANPHSIG